MKSLIYFLFALSVMVGCSDQSITHHSHYASMTFNIRIDNMQGEPTTRSASYQLDSATNVEYLLCDHNSVVIKSLRSQYSRENANILIEKLPVGDYTLYVLAYDNYIKDQGLTINEDISLHTDRWFSFSPEEGAPLLRSPQLLYGKHSFSITDDASINQEISLSHLVSAIDVKGENPSNYFTRSIKGFTVKAEDSKPVYSQFSVNGEFSGEQTISQEPLSLAGRECIFYTLPQATEETPQISVRMQNESHHKKPHESTYAYSGELRADTYNNVNINLDKHPYQHIGFFWFDKQDAKENKIPQILQDDEPKSIYYNHNERSFHLNQPVQFKYNKVNGDVHARFYLAKFVEKFSIYAQRHASDERLLLGYFDSIPAFADYKCRLSFKDFDKGANRFFLESGSMVELTESELSEYRQGIITFESDTEFWRKIYAGNMRAWMTFKSYGGDPDRPDGGVKPNKEFKGIRPVHIREAIALFQNFSYILTTEKFKNEMIKLDGKLYDNSKRPFPDPMYTVRQFENHWHFEVGLLKAHYWGVLGIAGVGGKMITMFEDVFIEHYRYARPLVTFFHELGHNIGYNHSSNMTYGIWAESFMNNFYIKNLHDFPYNNRDILQSYKNPNTYKNYGRTKSGADAFLNVQNDFFTPEELEQMCGCGRVH